MGPKGDGVAARDRRSQEERSRETSSKILDAAIDLIHDRGLTRLSTTDIAAHAGVSRGALTHHFASRDELIITAVTRNLQQVTETLHAFALEVAERGGSSDEIVDRIWDVMNDRLFYITLEYMPEARHNPEFRARLVPMVRDFHAALDAIWMALASRCGTDPETTRTVLNATMCLIRGMIAQTVLRDDPVYFAGLLAFWKDQVRGHFPSLPARQAPARGGKA